MLNQLNDEILLNSISDLVKKEKRTTLEILECLSEINSRQLHLKMGYSSLSDFCVRYLNYSEAEAARRMQAAQATRKVSEVKELLSNNELSLTGLSLIAPHITPSNAAALLPEVKNKSSREIMKVLAEKFPYAVKIKETEVLELDEELKQLIELAKKKASEKNITLVVKKALREFVKERPVRNTQIKKHTRYVQIASRRTIFNKAEHRCEYVGPNGVKCNQTAHLEIDHIRPWALGGSSRDLENLRVLCKAHNLMLARAQFPLTREAKIATGLRPSQ